MNLDVVDAKELRKKILQEVVDKLESKIDRAPWPTTAQYYVGENDGFKKAQQLVREMI